VHLATVYTNLAMLTALSGDHPKDQKSSSHPRRDKAEPLHSNKETGRAAGKTETNLFDTEMHDDTIASVLSQNRFRATDKREMSVKGRTVGKLIAAARDSSPSTTAVDLCNLKRWNRASCLVLHLSGRVSH